MKWKVLGELYPFEESLKRYLLSALAIALFVFLFLLVFQPFGLHNHRSDWKIVHIGGYGLITFIALFGNTLIFRILARKWYSKKSWTVGKNIVYTIWVFFCIGSLNLFYSAALEFITLSWDGLLTFQLITLLVGIFPVVITTLIIFYRRLKKMVKQAEDLNDLIPEKSKLENQIEIPSLNKSEQLRINIHELLAIKAIENYVELYTTHNGQLKKDVVRNTLQNVASSLTEYSFIKKCHRSYLVNLQNVDQFTGNAQGLTLRFKDNLNLEVPVSRTYVKEIRKELENC